MAEAAPLRQALIMAVSMRRPGEDYFKRKTFSMFANQIDPPFGEDRIKAYLTLRINEHALIAHPKNVYFEKEAELGREGEDRYAPSVRWEEFVSDGMVAWKSRADVNPKRKYKDIHDKITDEWKANWPTISVRIREECATAGIPLAHLARACGMSAQNLQHVLNHGTQKVTVLVPVCRILGLSLDWLIGDDALRGFMNDST